jgi:TRAP-type C4-dicarboxylate transport system permease small subunit
MCLPPLLGLTLMQASNLPPTAAPPPPWLQAYDRVLLGCDTVIGYVVTAAMAVLASVLILQVFFRYVMNDSLDWGNDVPRLAFIMIVVLSIPLAFRFNAHVGMDFDLAKLRFIGKAALNRFNALFMLVLFGTVAYYATQLASKTWDQMMPGLNVSVGMFYLSLAVGQAHCFLHVAKVLITGKLPEHHEAFET